MNIEIKFQAIHISVEEGKGNRVIGWEVFWPHVSKHTHPQVSWNHSNAYFTK